MLGFTDLALGQGPGIFKIRDNFDEWFIILELGVNQLNIRLILSY